MRRHPAVHRGGMSARSAFRRPVVQSASRSGSVSPAMSAARIARPLTPRMSVTTCVNFTFASSSVFCRRCVCRVISRTSCLRVRVRSRSSWSGPAARSCPESARAPTGRRSRPRRSGRAARNVPVCCARREHQRERLFVFEDVPHRLPVHAGRLHRHVRAARLGQPGRQFGRPAVVVANSRCSVGPAAMRTHAFTHREWTSAERRTGAASSLRQARALAGVRRSKSRARSPEESPVSQYGVLADSGSN